MAIRDLYPLKDKQFISGWDTVSFHLDGATKPLVGHILDFSYEFALNGSDFVYGSSGAGKPSGRRHGVLAVSGSFSCLDTFIKDLISDFSDAGVFHKQFSFSVVSIDPDGTINTTEFQKVNITKIGTAYKQSDTNMCSVSFQAQDAKVNGKALILPVA